jgi:hypothetical protein
MSADDLDDVAANVGVLIREEMEVQHRLGGHPVPVRECALCRAHIRMISPGGARP